MNFDRSHFITYKKQKLARYRIVVGINCSDGRILLQRKVVSPVHDASPSLGMWLGEPYVKLTINVCCQEQWERFDESYESHLSFVSFDFFNHHDAFIVPNLRGVVTTTCCNQIKMDSEIAADNVFGVAISSTSQHIESVFYFGALLSRWESMFVLFVHVHFYHFVPGCCYNSVIVPCISDVRYFSLLWIVRVQLQSVHS